MWMKLLTTLNPTKPTNHSTIRIMAIVDNMVGSYYGFVRNVLFGPTTLTLPAVSVETIT